MSDGHIYLIRFGGQPHVLPHSSLYPFRLFAFPPAGDVGKIVLPEGMQSVNFQSCKGLTGMAEIRGMSEGHLPWIILFNRF
jgi:hypothetical protein